MEDYEAFLDRALKQAPAIKTDMSRFVIPVPKIQLEGRMTILDNFKDTADVLNRDTDHLTRYLLREIGTAGKIEGSRMVFQGRFSADIIKSHIDNYAKEYVICSECGLPDTHLLKMDRVLMLKCDACGGHRPIKKRRVQKTTIVKGLEEDKVYEVRVDAVGRKGDGIAKMDKYTIFIPNVKTGDIAKVRIKKISGSLAFAELVERISSGQ